MQVEKEPLKTIVKFP